MSHHQLQSFSIWRTSNLLKLTDRNTIPPHKHSVFLLVTFCVTSRPLCVIGPDELGRNGFVFQGKVDLGDVVPRKHLRFRLACRIMVCRVRWTTLPRVPLVRLHPLWRHATWCVRMSELMRTRRGGVGSVRVIIHYYCSIKVFFSYWYSGSKECIVIVI